MMTKISYQNRDGKLVELTIPHEVPSIGIEVLNEEGKILYIARVVTSIYNPTGEEAVAELETIILNNQHH
jgi:hypothetical protein